MAGLIPYVGGGGGGNFLQTIETGLVPVKNELGPVLRSAAQNPTMRTAVGRVIQSEPLLLGSGEAATTAAAGGSAAGSLAALAPVIAAYHAGKIANLALDPAAREQASKDYTALQEKGVFSRALHGANPLNSVDTIYGAGKGVVDTLQSYSNAADGEAALNTPEARDTVKRVGKLQAVYEGLSDADKSRVDKMTGPERLQWRKTGEFPQKEARLGAGSALFPEGIKMPETTPMTQEKTPIFSEPKATAPAATPAAPAAPSRDIDSLFLKATGTKFDPKSRLDIARKAELEDLMKSKPELAGKSDTQVALQWYRQMENAKRK
jgi:hypothetical protein